MNKDGFTTPPEIVDMHFESGDFHEAKEQGKLWDKAGLYVWFAEAEEGLYRVEASTTQATVWGEYVDPKTIPLLVFMSDSIAPINARASLWAKEGLLIHQSSSIEDENGKVFRLIAEIRSERVVSKNEWRPK